MATHISARDCAPEYAAYNRIIIPAPAGKKFPSMKGWQNATQSLHKEVGKLDNACWVLQQTDLVVDVDIKNGGRGAESFTRLLEDLQIKLNPNVRTASGGWHCYLRLPAGVSVAEKLDAYPDIDFLSKGRQVVICGSQTEAGVYQRFDAADTLGWSFAYPCPPALLAALTKKHEPVVDNTPVDDGGLEEAIARDAVSKDDVCEWLTSESAACSYQEWFSILCRIKSWDSEAGFAIARDWSKTAADKYPGDAQFRKQWDNIKPAHEIEGPALGVGQIRRDVEYTEKSSDVLERGDAITKLKERITACETRESLLKLVSTLATEFKKDHDTLKKLCVPVKSHMNKIGNTSLTVDDVRELFGMRSKQSNERAIARARTALDDDGSLWTERFCYVPSANRFYDTRDYEALVAEAFDMQCNQYMPDTESGTKRSSAKFCADNGLLRRVNGIAYFPEREFDPLVEFDKHDPRFVKHVDGREYFNSFDHKKLSPIAETITDEGQAAFDRVMKHFTLLVGAHENKDEIMRQWFAWQIQHRGKQLRWAPFIQSTQGAGKSFLAALLEALLGIDNVGRLSTEQLLEKFNYWAANACVNICEEAHNLGETRDRLPNILKPKITDPYVSIRQMQKELYKVPNRTNYICFTNEQNALPLEDDDRRWFIVFSPLLDLEVDIPRLTGETREAYYSALWNIVRTPKLIPEIHRLLMDYPITDEFSNYIGAPMTRDKMSLLSRIDDDNEDFDIAMDILGDKSPFWNRDVICTAEFFSEVSMHKDSVSSWENHHRRKFLLKHNYKKYSKRITIGEKARCRVYVRNLYLTPDEIRASLAGHDQADEDAVDNAPLPF